MTRSWTRLHEHLGAAPGPPDSDMVRRAAADPTTQFGLDPQL
ncbi:MULTISPECIES: hypothetical protein [unclassified Streptomyces]|nr:hypothetical protein [Streptomyces sp. CB01580]